MSHSSKGVPAALACFGPVYTEPGRRPMQTQGPSTPQIIAFAMISSGLDDRVVWMTEWGGSPGHRLGPANTLDCQHFWGSKSRSFASLRMTSLSDDDQTAPLRILTFAKHSPMLPAWRSLGGNASFMTSFRASWRRMATPLRLKRSGSAWG